MTDHPITPPPELVKCFLRSNPDTPDGMTYEQFIATRFARWGADQELEACCEVLARELICDGKHVATDLRTVRRPKPPSLKEQALLAIDTAVADGRLSPDVSNVVRRALEQLDD